MWNAATVAVRLDCTRPSNHSEQSGLTCSRNVVFTDGLAPTLLPRKPKWRVRNALRQLSDNISEFLVQFICHVCEQTSLWLLNEQSVVATVETNFSLNLLLNVFVFDYDCEHTSSSPAEIGSN